MSFRIYYHPNAVNDRQKHTLIKASLSKTRQEGIISGDDALFLLAGCHAQNQHLNFNTQIQSIGRIARGIVDAIDKMEEAEEVA